MMQNRSNDWQQARDIVLRLLPQDGEIGRFRKSFPYQYGTIELTAPYGAEWSRFPVSAQVAIRHVQGRRFVVLRMEFTPSGIVVSLFKDGQWVKALQGITPEEVHSPQRQLVAQAMREDEDPWSPVKDGYLFPEYAYQDVALDQYPMAGGKKRRWRKGWEDVDDWVQASCKKHGRHGGDLYQKMKATRVYEDERVRLFLYRAYMARRAVDIRSPKGFPGEEWRCVLRIDLRGGTLMSMRFKPGKWIYYVRDLATK